MANEYSTTNRLETKIQRIISQVILHKIKDKRLQRISIDEIRLSRDLSFAKIFCSTLHTDESFETLEKLLTKASGFLFSIPIVYKSDPNTSNVIAGSLVGLANSNKFRGSAVPIPTNPSS